MATAVSFASPVIIFTSMPRSRKAAIAFNLGFNPLEFCLECATSHARDVQSGVVQPNAL